MIDPTVQTRSEENGLVELESLAAALDAARQDETVWKISFNSASGERVRLVRIRPVQQDTMWVYKAIFPEVERR